MLASCTISLHLSAIFTFVAVFVRLKERMLDPRLLVWICIMSFVCFYTLWELVEHIRSDTSRFIDRKHRGDLQLTDYANGRHAQVPRR